MSVDRCRAIGLEDPDDLIADLDAAFKATS